jgi:hypothetical protein
MMGRSAADKRRQQERNDRIVQLAADLGLLPEVSIVDRLMLTQVADLLSFHPFDMEAMGRADAVRRLLEYVEHRHCAMGRRAGCRAKPQKRPYRPMGMRISWPLVSRHE